MVHSFQWWLKMLRESFVPVVLVILGIFLLLLYVQFRAEYNADKVTVIDIQSGGYSSLVEHESVTVPGISGHFRACPGCRHRPRASACPDIDGAGKMV